MDKQAHFSLYDFTSPNIDYSPEYTISGVTPKKGLVTIIGPYAAGKTQLVMRMGASVASSIIFGDGKTSVPVDEIEFDFCCPRESGYTLYFTGEGTGNILGRIEGTKRSLPDYAVEKLNRDYNGILPIIPVKVDIPLKDGPYIEEIENIIKQAQQALPI